MENLKGLIAEEKAVYYSLYDEQCHQVMETGRNSRNLEELKAGLLSYLSADHDDKEMATLNRLTAHELAEMFEFRIDEHAEPLDKICEGCGEPLLENQSVCENRHSACL